MKISKQVPTEEIKSVQIKPFTATKPGSYKVFMTIPTEIGEMQFDGDRSWVTDDGYTFRHVREVEKLFRNRAQERGIPLPSGRYSAPTKRIEQRDGKIILHLKNGEQITLVVE